MEQPRAKRTDTHLPNTTLVRSEAAGEQLEPHQVTTYLLELAQAFQTYYHDHQFLVDDAGPRDARLALALAVRQVLANGLDLVACTHRRNCKWQQDAARRKQGATRATPAACRAGPG